METDYFFSNTPFKIKAPSIPIIKPFIKFYSSKFCTFIPLYYFIINLA